MVTLERYLIDTCKLKTVESAIEESKKENKTCKELRLVRSFLLSGFHRESLKVYAYFFRGLFFTDCKCVKIVLDAGRFRAACCHFSKGESYEV